MKIEQREGKTVACFSQKEGTIVPKPEVSNRAFTLTSPDGLLIEATHGFKLEGVPMIVKDDVDKLAIQYAKEKYRYNRGYAVIDFKEGFNAAKQKYEFTAEDMLRLAIHCWNTSSRPEYGKTYYINDIVDKYLQSLRVPEYLEVEAEEVMSVSGCEHKLGKEIFKNSDAWLCRECGQMVTNNYKLKEQNGICHAL